MTNNLNILIVDDDKSFRRILQLRLKSYYPSLLITESQTISEAQDIINKNSSFDLLILDQHLPDGRGADLLVNNPQITMPVLALSSDEDSNLPADTVTKGARFFLSKSQVSQSFFLPLVDAIIQRARIEKEAHNALRSREILDSIRTLLRTLQHEIHNPLGAVFGAMYLLQSEKSSEKDKKKAIELIEQSSQRIKTVIEKLYETAELEKVTKGDEILYQIPGDPSWEK